MINYRSPFIVILTLFCFIWLCLATDFSFARSEEEDSLKKAKRLSYQGDYTEAVYILKDYIIKFDIEKGEKKDLAFAYYLLGRTYYMAGDDQLAEENLEVVYKTLPEFETDEEDLLFKSFAKKVADKTLSEMEKKKKLDKELEEKKVPVEEKIKPKLEKKELEKIEPETKKKEDKKIKVKQTTGKVEKKVITSPVKKKKKKKFPWILVIGGIVIIGLACVLLLSKKDDSGGSGEQGGSKFDTDVLGIEWINIPAGEFEMGDNFNEGESDEKPVHTVYLSSYNISKYEVTFDQYDRYCEETGRPKPDDEGWGRGNRPVINVNWNEASAFCQWLSGRTGKNIHLLTEAQWEKAARGHDQRRYPWGNTSPDCSKTNYNSCVGKTSPVGSYPSGISPYGVHDLAGNVYEWCFDYYSSIYYSASPYSNPTGPTISDRRVLRGGSWYRTDDSLRAANRSRSLESFKNFEIGFRLCFE